jgi:hypothetical protein
VDASWPGATAARGRASPQNDFTVLEDGREQKVVSFDVVKQDPPSVRGLPDPAPWPGGHERRTRGPARPHLRHRFDNIHMSPQGARSAKPPSPPSSRRARGPGRRPPRLDRRQLLVERARGEGA